MTIRIEKQSVITKVLYNITFQEKTAKDLYQSLKEGKQEERIESLKRLVKLATVLTVLLLMNLSTDRDMF